MATPGSSRHGGAPLSSGRPAAKPEAAAQDMTLMERILAAVRGLEYGSVEIVVHDSRVVQIERREKMRMTDRPG